MPLPSSPHWVPTTTVAGTRLPSGSTAPILLAGSSDPGIRSTEDGRQRTIPTNQGQSDDQGQFHIGHLAPGTYYLAVSARPGTHKTVV